MIALLRIREIKPRPRVYVSLSLKLPLAIFALTLIDIGDKKKTPFQDEIVYEAQKQHKI